MLSLFRQIIVFSLTVGLCFSSLAVSSAAPGILDPNQADADFAEQGEYVGDVETEMGTVRYGAQVVALGDGQFLVKGYAGGLPGEGWNGMKPLSEVGSRVDGTVQFEGERASGKLRDGVMEVFANGLSIGSLKRVNRTSPTLSLAPPEGALVLFDGTSASAFEGGRISPEGWLEQGCTTKEKFDSFQLHLEFMLSYMPKSRGQSRANSGCYSQGRYEVQILDSFGLDGKNNECGGIYELHNPKVNMCFPPLSWQTYDIDFTAATFGADGKKTADARLTVRQNGVLIHDHVELPRGTRAAPVAEGSEPGPLYLQDHGDLVRFRNIWIVRK